MHREYTVRQFAAHERVTERTVRRWIVKGAVEIRRTPGGGIRILERRERESPVSNDADYGHLLTS